MFEIDSVLPEIDQLREGLRTLHSPLLRSVKIKLTSLCNLRCQMCHYWKNESEQALTTEQWLRVIDQLGEMGCRKIHFSGGEVFLRRDFLDLVERARERKIKVNMTTNGTLLTPDRVRRLVKARPNSLSFSLDGPRARLHDHIRGLPGSFERTCRTIRRIRKRGEQYGRVPRLRINFVMQRMNFRTLPAMVELAGRLGVNEIHPMPVDEKGDRKNRLSRGQILRYNAEIAPLVLEARERWGFSTHPSLVYPLGRLPEELKLARDGLYSLGFYQRRPCLVPWLHLFLGWDGEAYLCCMTNRRMESLGNVARTSVADVFNGEPMRAVRRRFLEGRLESPCARCDMAIVENERLFQQLGEPFRSLARPS